MKTWPLAVANRPQAAGTNQRNSLQNGAVSKYTRIKMLTVITGKINLRSRRSLAAFYIL